jgi:UDP-3-O-[3-hydroxymyristoyl] glucosamine N-acyltransferase
MRLDELAKRLGVGLLGDGSIDISSVGPLDDATPDQLSFYANPRYAERFTATRAGAVCVNRGIARPGINLLLCDDPLDAFRRAVTILLGPRRQPFEGVHAMAFVDPTATLGARTTVYPFAYVGPGAVIGHGCVIGPGASVHEGCRLGDRVTLHAGAVVGVDGFGYATPAGLQHGNPRAGTVTIEDDVEIGAGSVIERAALGATVIAKGTRIAHLVCIGHGTKVGRDCLLVSQTGIAGKTTVGDHVSMGGQVGIAGHLHIGDRAKIGAQSGVMDDVPPDTDVLGSPAFDIRHARRVYAGLYHLPELIKRVKELERELSQLKSQLELDPSSDDDSTPGV